MVVPKRAEPAATRRNYAKRLIRELVRSRLRDIQGFDLVVRLRKAILREDAPLARAELERLLGEVRQ
ncbi:MAG: ribonuclease P protein component [Betaproteobacteria bacterium]|nr:ribonuclease P protein component [Betaproteobacteria bacterium]